MTSLYNRKKYMEEQQYVAEWTCSKSVKQLKKDVKFGIFSTELVDFMLGNYWSLGIFVHTVYRMN